MCRYACFFFSQEEALQGGGLHRPTMGMILPDDRDGKSQDDDICDLLPLHSLHARMFARRVCTPTVLSESENKAAR